MTRKRRRMQTTKGIDNDGKEREMKGFENFTTDQQKMISEYADWVPSVSVKTSRSGRKTYTISTWEGDYKFRTKKEFLEVIETALKEWECEA